MDGNDRIRLRSETVRKVIGTVPPRPVRIGTGILCLLFAALLAAASLIPYPETVTAQAVIHRSGDNGDSVWTAVAEIPYSLISRIRPGMAATLEMEGWSAADYGYVSGRITAIDPTLLSVNGVGHFKIVIEIIPPAADDSRTRGQNRIPLQANQNAEAAILISDRSLIQMMLRKSP